MKLIQILPLSLFLFLISSGPIVYGQFYTTSAIWYDTPEEETTRRLQFYGTKDLFVAGQLRGEAGPEAIFLKKIEEPAFSGQLLWHRTYDDSTVVENLRDFRIASDGNLLLLVEQRTNWNIDGLFSANCSLMKLDTAGNVLWQSTFDSGGKDIPIRLMHYSDGTSLVLGISDGAAGNNFGDDFLWLPVDSEGNFEAAQYIEVDESESPIDFEMASDGSIYALESTELTKLDKTGLFLWEKPLSENNEQVLVTDLYILPDGDLLVGGAVESPITFLGLDASIIKYDAAGEFVWQQTYGDEGIEIIERMITCSENGEIVAIGQDTDDDLIFYDGFYFLVTDQEGNELSSTTYGEDGTSQQYGLDIIHTAEGRVVGGGLNNEEGTDDVMLITTIQVDFTCFPTGLTSAREIDQQLNITIAPNPNKGSFQVYWPQKSLEDAAVFHLFNAFGQQIETVRLNSSTSALHHPELAPGIYFYQITSDRQLLANGKLIIE